jgi:hypothetical protein
VTPAQKRAERVATPYTIVPPDKIQIVSYSELDTARQCPLKHHLSYDRRWTKAPAPGGALAKGSLYHMVMETHYKVLKQVQDEHKGRIPKGLVKPTLLEARNACYAYLVDERTGEFLSEVHDLIAWMYDGYVDNYGVDEEYRLVAIEQQIITPLPDENGNDSRYHLKAKLDLIVREWSTGFLWVWDHKSGGNLPTSMDLEIDDQFGLYVWAMRKAGKKVLGAIHSANRTQRNKTPMTLESRMSRTYLNRTDVECQNIALDAYYVAKAVYPDDPANRLRFSSPDPRQCGWKCDFKEPHLMMRKGRNPDEVMIEAGYTVNRTRH